MSWGTTYVYEGYINRVGIDELEAELGIVQDELGRIRSRLLSIMAMSAPPSGNIEVDGKPVPWYDHVCEQLVNAWNDAEDLFTRQTTLQQAIEVKKENPKKLREG